VSSTENDASASPIPEYRIPAILTTSAAEMLQYFGNKIIELEASASIQVQNKDDIMNDYGMLWQQRQSQRIEFDYREVPNSDGIAQNPITDDKIDEIFSHVEKRLDSADIDAAPDLSVTHMVIEVECPELTDVLRRSHTDRYTLTFKSDRITSDAVRKKTEELNMGKSLYDELRWEKRNLNLRRVEETRAKHTQQSNSVMMKWSGPGDTRPITDRELSDVVRDEILPDGFTHRLKQMQVIDDDKIQTVGFSDGGATPDE